MYVLYHVDILWHLLNKFLSRYLYWLLLSSSSVLESSIVRIDIDIGMSRYFSSMQTILNKCAVEQTYVQSHHLEFNLLGLIFTCGVVL